MVLFAGVRGVILRVRDVVRIVVLALVLEDVSQQDAEPDVNADFEVGAVEVREVSLQSRESFCVARDVLLEDEEHYHGSDGAQQQNQHRGNLSSCCDALNAAGPVFVSSETVIVSGNKEGEPDHTESQKVVQRLPDELEFVRLKVDDHKNQEGDIVHRLQACADNSDVGLGIAELSRRVAFILGENVVEVFPETGSHRLGKSVEVEQKLAEADHRDEVSGALSQVSIEQVHEDAHQGGKHVDGAEQRVQPDV